MTGFLSHLQFGVGSNNTVANSLSPAAVCTVTLSLDYAALSHVHLKCPDFVSAHESSSLLLITLQLASDLPDLICDLSLGHP